MKDRLRYNLELFSDKSKNPLTRTEFIKHGDDETGEWLDEVIDLKADFSYVDKKISEIELTPEFKTDSDQIQLEDNILAGRSWNLGNGWSGSYESGFFHATGKSETLECPISEYENCIYVLKFTATNQYASTSENALIVSVGGSPAFEQYQDDGTVTKYFTFMPSEGNVVFTPSTNWNGSVYDIGLYKIQYYQVVSPAFVIKDTENHNSFEVVVTKANLNNVIIGRNTLSHAVSARENIAIGNEIMENNATGYFNVAIGPKSQKYSIGGTRNVSVGYASLSNISYGDRNVAIGSFALAGVTTGRNNIGIGADAAWHTSEGSHNIALSNGALNSNSTGSGNIALGYFAASGNRTGDRNIAIGYLSNSYNEDGRDNIALGYFAHYKGESDKYNIALGYRAMVEHGSDDTQDNIAIGRESLYKNTGSDNISIGRQNIYSPTQATSQNIAIGLDLMSQNVTCGLEAGSIVIGRASGRNIAGNENIVFGRGSLNGACGSYNLAIGNSVLANNTKSGNIGIGYRALNSSDGEKNIAIGYTAGSNVSTASNTICIGASGRNFNKGVYIGDAIYFNGSKMGICGIDATDDAILTIPAGKSDVAPIKINAGTLTSSPRVGTIEYDGLHLYFTDRSGVRHQLAVEEATE